MIATAPSVDGSFTQIGMFARIAAGPRALTRTPAAYPRPAPHTAASEPSRTSLPSAAERPTELTALLTRGMITQAEYDERRKAIIGSR